MVYILTGRNVSMKKHVLRYALLLLVMAIAVAPIFAQSDTITVDTGMFIGAINNWLGMAMSIIAIGVGISGAFALAVFVGNMIVGALRGNMGGGRR